MDSHQRSLNDPLPVDSHQHSPDDPNLPVDSHQHSPDDPLLPSLRGYRPSTVLVRPDAHPADPATVAELQAIADSVLSDPRERVLWDILHDPSQVDGRTHLKALCERAGYTDIGTGAPAIINKMFGKMEAAGISRARSYDVMVGFTAEAIKAGLARLFSAEDDRIKAKAFDISSKVLGMQQPSSTQVNVQVNNTTILHHADALVDAVCQSVDDED